MRTSTTVVALATFSRALATFQGFNYASTFNNNAAKQQSDFEDEFKTAQGLTGAPGTFSSARLYTMVQAGTPNDPISAIPAAISTKTSLLLGLWASGGDANFANELQALKSAIAKYGKDLGPLVAGISVGSEDLYRISPTGILNHENVGTGPDVLAGYIKQVRDVIAGTALSGASIGHVDTWTAWVNASNKATIDAVDWVGVDAYPYFEDTHDNSIANSKNLFQDAFSATAGAVGGKPVWVTETGFPISGKTVGKAVANVDNAQKYWQDVGCSLFGKTNVWWYTLHDADPTTPNPTFGIVGDKLSTTPLFDLSCKAVSSSTSSSSSAGTTSTSTGSGSDSGSTSESATKTSVSVPSSALGGGSPGATINSSQQSLQTKTTQGGGETTPSATSTSGSGTGSGSSSNSTASTTTAKSSSTASTTPNGAVAYTGSSISAAFAAMMVAILAL